MVFQFLIIRGKMKKLCIFGAGGFAKEVYWLAKQCDQAVDAFIDLQSGSYFCDGKKIEGEDYFNPDRHTAIVAVGNSNLRKKIVEQIITKYGDDVFTTLISPYANLMSNTITIGKGSVICANCILTCDIVLGDFAQLNLATTIGHDTKTGSFFTTAPGVHISGKVNTGNQVYLGTNASIIEDIEICDDIIIGAAACVSKNIVESGIYVGVPAKKMEKKNG